MYCVGFIPFNFVLASVKVPVYRTNDNGTLERVGTNVEGWVHGHCIDSNQKIQDEIDSVRASLAEIRGSGGTKGTGKVYPTREIDTATEVHIIDRVKELRGKLTSGYKKSGNFALAEVDVKGIDKSEFFAQSSINELNGTLEERIADISLKPNNPTFKASKVADKNGIEYPRDSDTEYKILNDIANRLGNNTEAKGKIKLFTELDTCYSCSRVIAEFAQKYKNIELEVIPNNGNRLKP
ncbi:deaminase domain-containing protein [Bacillus cereus]|uniref:deaminase domain-containing protein n=1 Tax=Bacillus sp. OE TaxID=2293320 RepID=UPI001CB9D76E